jgi:TRAP-type C4-dicarboxylate transport system permease small subunit
MFFIYIKHKNMERGLTMIVHAAIIGIILYLIMRYALKQESHVAEDRSVLIFAIVVIYMVLFGHGMPTSINHNIM